MVPGMKAKHSVIGYYREEKASCHHLLFLFKTCHQSEMYGFSHTLKGVISPPIHVKWIVIPALRMIKSLRGNTVIVIDIGCKIITPTG